MKRPRTDVKRPLGITVLSVLLFLSAIALLARTLMMHDGLSLTFMDAAPPRPRCFSAAFSALNRSSSAFRS